CRVVFIPPSSFLFSASLPWSCPLSLHDALPILYGDHAPVTAAADGTVELTVPALGAVVLVADAPVAAAGDAQTIALAPADGGKVEGLAPISAVVAADRWAETTVSYRLAGQVAWTPLGTAEDDT